MKVCDVVLNSIWYDPRVRKQIVEYMNNAVDVVCVGYRDNRYDEEKTAKIPCPAVFVQLESKYESGKLSPIKKLVREFKRAKLLEKAIVAQKPDIIHANDLNTLAAACWAAKKLKCKVVYDSHEICTENICFHGMYKKLNILCEKVFIKRIDHMVCVSHAAADYFAKRYKIEKPMVVTNCSLKSEQVISSEKNEGFEVLNHGQFYEGRGYDIMVEAIPFLNGFSEIKLAARGFGKLEDQLRARAKELGDENFIFYPKVLVQDLIPYASRSMVGVAITEATCLNFELSVSNKLFEYASAGLPVIMSDIPEHRYLNEKYEFGIIIPDNAPESFAKAAIKLYTDKDFYAKCADNAKRLSEEINWENEFGKLIMFERSCFSIES